jgi:4-amino-4-deoxychorismate lyase
MFETLKWVDGRVHLIDFHQKRLARSLVIVGNDHHCVPSLESHIQAYPGPENGVYKCHVTYDATGNLFSPNYVAYQPRMIRSLVCREASRIDYSLKWEDRSDLQCIGSDLSCDEEVLILRDGWITDTRYSNVVFGDGSEWVTPETYLLPGVKRAALLNRGLVRSIPMRVDDMKRYPYCSLINAMLDPGEVMISTEAIRLFC